jgi:glycosyltransferase involved in cell wall biosynthesis
VNILFVIISTAPFAPNDLLAYRAAEELLRLGHRVLVSPWDWGDRNASEYDELKKKGAILTMRDGYSRSENFFIRQIQKARHRIRDPRTDWLFADEFHPDAILISDPATYHFLSVPGLVEFLTEREVPFFIISQYNDENAYLSEQVYRKARSVFAKARRCFFVSSRNLDIARRQLCHDLSQAIVVHNPPNLGDWSRISYPKGNRPQYCMVARLECAVKGQALVLQALSEPAWRDRDWSLSIFGKGPDETYLRDLIGYIRLHDKVWMRGFSHDVRSVWNEHQILVMASSGEGKPLALTEAMLCGRPAIVTDVGGNADFVIDGVTGFVAQSATLASVRDALERSWVERNSWEKMGVQAHNLVARALDPPPGHIVASTIVDDLCRHNHGYNVA